MCACIHIVRGHNGSKLCSSRAEHSTEFPATRRVAMPPARAQSSSGQQELYPEELSSNDVRTRSRRRRDDRDDHDAADDDHDAADDAADDDHDKADKELANIEKIKKGPDLDALERSYMAAVGQHAAADDDLDAQVFPDNDPTMALRCHYDGSHDDDTYNVNPDFTDDDDAYDCQLPIKKIEKGKGKGKGKLSTIEEIKKGKGKDNEGKGDNDLGFNEAWDNAVEKIAAENREKFMEAWKTEQNQLNQGGNGRMANAP